MAAAKSPHRTANFVQALTYTLIFTAILVTINFLANRYNKSLDSTQNKRYSLSEQSAKIARDLKEKMTITYWDRASEFERARGLMDRYKNLSPNLDVQYEDVDRKRTAAIAAGVSSYGTIIVQVGNKKEIAKTLTEEDVTNAMVRALKGGDRAVCFTLGSGEASTDDTNAQGYSNVKALTEKNNYKTQTLKMVEKAEIPLSCTVVVAGGPKRNYIQPIVDALKMFVENGGRAMFLLDPPLKFGSEIDDNAALVGVLDGWGVKLHSDLVLDESGVGQLFGLGPEAPLVTSYESHPIVNPLKEVPTLFPITRSLEVKDAGKSKVSKLFATTDQSVATRNLASASINMKSATEKGPFPLAAAGEYDTGTPEKGKGRFVVVGTSRWIANGYLPFNGNRDLYMNMINWLTSDEDLISIRPKEPEDRPLNMNARQVSMLFYSSVLGIPLLVVIAGVGVWWRRR
jgi:ABC-type uncharacterized transport system involved in gliding motility auxiliary subunit